MTILFIFLLPQFQFPPALGRRVYKQSFSARLQLADKLIGQFAIRLL